MAMEKTALNHKEYEEWISKIDKITINRGNVYSFPQAVGWGFWTVVHKHPKDDNLWFVVVTDIFPNAIGSYDLAVPKNQFGPLALRCSYGIWLPSEFIINEGKMISQIPEFTVDYAQFKVHQFVSGKSDGRINAEIVTTQDYYEELIMNPAQETVIGLHNVLQKFLEL